MQLARSWTPAFAGVTSVGRWPDQKLFGSMPIIVDDQDHLRTCTPQAFCISPLCPLDSVPYLFYGAWMDWAFAIERNREPLLRIVAALFAMIGLTEAG